VNRFTDVLRVNVAIFLGTTKFGDAQQMWELPPKDYPWQRSWHPLSSERVFNHSGLVYCGQKVSFQKLCFL